MRKALANLLLSGRSRRAHLTVRFGAVIMAGLLISPLLLADTVTLPAGSNDGLGAAIAAAGPGGVVIVESGTHTEGGTVLIEVGVSILGEPGSVIRSATTPDTSIPISIDAALHVRNTSDVTIQGLTLSPPEGQLGNTAVFIENAPNVTVAANTIEGYGYGVVVQDGNRADISANLITLATDPPGAGLGITIINGRFARINDNAISDAQFGIWACDLNGRATRNTTSNSLIGIILCKVPPALEIAPGVIVGSRDAATSWHVHENMSTGNFWGYAITDGSHDNVLANNAASGNTIDVEILGDSMFFGFFTPTVFDNTVALGTHKDLTVHDCGVNSTINGNANLLDTSQVPCF